MAAAVLHTLRNCLAAKQVALLLSEVNNCLCLNLSFVLRQQLAKLGGVWSTWHILHLLLLITGNSEYVKRMWWQRLKILLSNTGRCATCKLL